MNLTIWLSCGGVTAIFLAWTCEVFGEKRITVGVMLGMIAAVICGAFGLALIAVTYGVVYLVDLLSNHSDDTIISWGKDKE